MEGQILDHLFPLTIMIILVIIEVIAYFRDIKIFEKRRRQELMNKIYIGDDHYSNYNSNNYYDNWHKIATDSTDKWRYYGIWKIERNEKNDITNISPTAEEEKTIVTDEDIFVEWLNRIIEKIKSGNLTKSEEQRIRTILQMLSCLNFNGERKAEIINLIELAYDLMEGKKVGV